MSDVGFSGTMGSGELGVLASATILCTMSPFVTSAPSLHKHWPLRKGLQLKLFDDNTGLRIELVLIDAAHMLMVVARDCNCTENRQ